MTIRKTQRQFYGALADLPPTGLEGSIYIATDTDQFFIYDENGLPKDFIPEDPTDIVFSVNSRTGDVILTKNDVGLGNVDNTSDYDKPISDATQEALDNKISFNSVVFSRKKKTNSGVFLDVGEVESSEVNGYTISYPSVIDSVTISRVDSDASTLEIHVNGVVAFVVPTEALSSVDDSMEYGVEIGDVVSVKNVGNIVQDIVVALNFKI